MAAAHLNHADTCARRQLRADLSAATFAETLLSNAYRGTLEHAAAAVSVVRTLETALATARQLAAVAHANAGHRHGEVAYPELPEALRRWPS